MKLLVFQHIECEHPGVFRALLDEADIQWDAVELDAGEEIPALESYAALGQLVQFRRFALRMPESAQRRVEVVGHQKQNIRLLYGKASRRKCKYSGYQECSRSDYRSLLHPRFWFSSEGISNQI